MDRRNLLKLTALAGIGMAAEAPAEAAAPAVAADRAPGMAVARDGTRLFVRDWGQGEAVLFMAGWTLPSDFWGYRMLALKQAGYRAIAYDRRGHGRSDDPGRGYDFDTLADDLAAVIAQCGLKRVTLVAHSMASGEVARYVARHGTAKIARIVFVGAITPFLMKTLDNPAGMPREALAASRAALAKDFPGVIAAQFRPFFTAETPQATIDWVTGLMLRTSIQAVNECAAAMMETDFRADLAKIDVPVQVIHGDRDASAPLPLTGARTAELIRGAALSVYEGAPHGLPLTHGEQLHAELLELLKA